MKKPVVLIILDGFGVNAHTEEVNAITLANPVNFNSYLKKYPHTELRADGEFVGLPEGQFGNSEVGHLNIGAGRIVYQQLPKITKAIKDGTILENVALANVMDETNKNSKALHIIGLLSDGGVHSHINHLIGLVEMAKKKGLEEVYIHAILDGRDTPPSSGEQYIADMEKALNELGIGRIATITGRYYAMDRDKNWDRVKEAYDCLVNGKGKYESSALEAIKVSYTEGITDEFVKAINITQNDAPIGCIKEGDGVIFANFRPDRARELTRAIVDKNFNEFERPNYSHVNFVCMAEYDKTIDAPVAFPPEIIINGFGEVVSKAGLTQIRTAETEKYAHVTFFFNGGKEEPYEGEKRILVDSPKVATYDLQPEMSAYKVKDALLQELAKGETDVVILNFANPDMVGHTGVIPAAIQAVQAVDNCLGQIVRTVLDMDGCLLITADHGNVDLMVDPITKEPFTAHTANPVPFVFIANNTEGITLRNDGKLADLTPTMLAILGVEKPAEMTGESLIIK